MLKLGLNENAKIQASDTYDVASLVLSRLLHIASLVDADVALAPVYYPGKMVPSDAYQRASVLGPVHTKC